MSDLTKRIPLIGGERPEPGGAITTPEQLAYVLSEIHDDASPMNIRRWLLTAKGVWGRLPLASVKPWREAIARALQKANRSGSGRLNGDQREAAESAAFPAYLALADAILTLWPGKTEAEVREQVAAELRERAKVHAFPARLAIETEADRIAREGGQR